MLRTILAALLVGFVALGGVAAALYVYNRPAELRVAVAQDGQDFRLITAAGQVFSRHHEPIRLKIVPVADATAAAASLEQGAADLAVVRNNNLPPDTQALVILHRNAALLVAPGGSNLHRVADLRGKKIGVVHAGNDIAADTRLLETILAQYDVAKKNVTLVSLTPVDVKSSIETHQVDSIFMVAVPQIGVASDVVGQIAAARGKAPVFIPISEAKAIAKRSPALEPTEIVHGAFGGDPPRPEKEFDSLSVSFMLMARNSLSNALAGEVTRQFFAYRATIALHAPLANNIEAPSTDKGSAVSVHPGAADFLDDNEKGFLERYSDYIYLGAMFMSVVGSAAAALASRLKIRTQERSEQLTERLLEILQAARTAATGMELDGFEREVDELLVHSLADLRLRNAATTELHMVALALDQARLAIQDRRHVLTGSGEVVAFVPRRNIGPAE